VSIQHAVPIVLDDTRALVTEVQHNGRVFRLKEVLVLARSAENGLIYFESEPLSILSYGRSPDEAIQSFCEDFAMMWDVIAEAPDDTLTQAAQKVKRTLKALVKSVAPE
jgi:hypothetical protein